VDGAIIINGAYVNVSGMKWFGVGALSGFTDI